MADSTVSPSGILALVAALVSVFFANNPTAEEIVQLLSDLLPVITAIQSGTATSIPAFRVGNSTVGPIPIAPIS